MVVASSTADHLEHALGRSASRFAIRSGRAASRWSRTGAGIGSSGESEGRSARAGLPARGPGRPELSGGSRVALSSACPGRWPTGSARSRSSRRWAARASWGSSAPPGCPRRGRAGDRRIQHGLGDAIPYGMNLIHSPGEPDAGGGRRRSLSAGARVRLVEASAFLNLTLPVVRYRVAGIRRDGSGRVVAPNRIIAKVSRVEVASKFLAPPPDQFLRELVATGEITRRAGRVGGANPDGRGHHGRGRFGRAYRQPAGDRAVADDAGAARPDAGAVPLRAAAPRSARPAASRRRGPRRRRWRWGRPTW